MAAKRKAGRGASRQSEASGGGAAALRWYSLGLASGLFVALVIYLATLPAEQTDSIAAAPVEAERPKPQFDFYEMLPNSSIEVDVDPAELPEQREATTSGQLLLQAGSFRDAQDADRRRAQLLLLGLEPSVEESLGDNGRWYRVIIGPFESRSAMAHARSLTAQQQIETLQIRRNAG